MAIDYVGNGNPDGTVVVPESTSKLGFFGTAPTAKTTIATIATAATVATAVASIQAIIAELKAKGLVA